MPIHDVVLSTKATKDLKKVPKHIVLKLMGWIEAVNHSGLHEVRKVPGYHDEPLSGVRKGQRSIRLSKGYRAIYEISKDNKMELVEILEVNKHAY